MALSCHDSPPKDICRISLVDKALALFPKSHARQVPVNFCR